MNDKNDFDPSPDDEFYDDALDDNFDLDEENYDDFDLESELEDSEYGEDVLDDSWDTEEEKEPRSLPSEKKSKFNTIVIIIALIFGVFIVLSQVKKERAALDVENPPEVLQPTALRMEGAFEGPGGIKRQKDEKSDEAFETPDVPKEPNEERGFLFDADILGDSKDVLDDTPPMPTPITSEQDAVMEQQSEEGVVVYHDEGAEDKKSALSDARQLSEGAENSILEDIQSASDTVAQNQNKDAEAALEASQSAALTQKLDAILQRLDGLEGKINEVKNDNSVQIKGILTDLDRLEKERQVSKPLEPVVVQKKAEKPVVAQKIEKTKQAPKTLKTDKKPAVKKITKSAPVKWELRAAQPGKAWVSQKGKRDMKPVVVGDKLKGIGRIEAIQHLNGRWIVQGSTGKITQ